MDNTITTTAHQAAVELNMRIKATGQLITTALVDFCRQLKEMRDRHLYTELGYEGFDAYVEAEAGIKARQAYYYISTYERLGPKLLEENSGLGITKLRIIADVPALDRTEFVEENDLDSMTVDDLRNRLKEVYGVNEQLTMQLEERDREQDALDDAGLVDEWSDRLREAEEARAAAEAELAAIKENAAGSSDVDKEALRSEIIDDLYEQMKADAEAEAEAGKEKAVKAAKKEAAKEAAEKAKQEAAAELEKARKEAAKEAEERARTEMSEKLAALEEEAAAAEERARKLEKEMNLNAGKETAAFALHFDQLQQHFAKMVELIEAVQGKGDEEGAEKLAGAVENLLDMLKSQLYEEQ